MGSHPVGVTNIRPAGTFSPASTLRVKWKHMAGEKDIVMVARVDLCREVVGVALRPVQQTPLAARLSGTLKSGLMTLGGVKPV
jgi:hypothetical protein